MTNNVKAILAAAPRKASKKPAAAKQEILFEKNLPPLTASVRQTFSGDVIFSTIGVAAILAVAALYIIRKADIKI